MRTSNNRTIGRTPAEMVYGIKIMMPELWDSRNPKILGNNETFDDRDIFFEEIVNRKKAVVKESKKREQIEKDKWKSKYDKKVRIRNFKIGEYVLRVSNRRSHHMEPINEGPFQIEEHLGRGTYKISDMQGRIDIVNADKLKKYNIGIDNTSENQRGTTRTVYPNRLS
ncbi:hypothetical protein AYI69_g7298 [Smittium culicis]|uniref:Uncharacterized protein n=1 Tax=Smittium culicis TaxID=133412 RepID=A0A1R1XT36_9FUNG|nr:hypothetical protein AYI69_g7298 [Smittium culicis]